MTIMETFTLTVEQRAAALDQFERFRHFHNDDERMVLICAFSVLSPGYILEIGVRSDMYGSTNEH
jgi:hypothetical protein